MQELQKDEIDAVNGGAILIILAGAALAVAFGIGVYNAYKQDAAAAEKGK